MSASEAGGATRVAGIRGAIDVKSDTPAAITAAVGELVREMTARNGLEVDRVISAQFTVTPDVHSIFPAAAAREAGWGSVPMLCAQAVDVPGAMPRCVRVLVLAELRADQKAEHVYMGEAAALRPDLAGGWD